MKILISDVDGTLIHDGDIISVYNIVKMKELQAQGHLIALCTGRQFFEIKWVLDQYHFPFDYLILNNGAQILDKHYQKIYDCVISRDVGQAILDYTTKFSGLWSYYSDGKLSYGYKDGQCVEHMSQQEKVVSGSFQDCYQSAQQFEIISFHQDDQNMDITKMCYEYIQKHFHQEVEAYYNLHYVDVVAKGCSKGQGLNTLCEMLKIPRHHIYAIGDSYNDLSMLQEVQNSYTFVYAQDEIRKMIPRHVRYVYEVIEEMLGGETNELAR